MTRAKQELLERLACGRLGAKMVHLAPAQGLATRWKPKVAGIFVRNDTDPADGFLLRVDAIDAARTYRQNCKAVLEKLSGVEK